MLVYLRTSTEVSQNRQAWDVDRSSNLKVPVRRLPTLVSGRA
jgi:hypothetical protein